MMLFFKNKMIKVYWENLKSLSPTEEGDWQKNIPQGLAMRRKKNWNSVTEVAQNESLKYGALAVLAEKDHADWSLSQSANYMLVGYSDQNKIGVDIERIDRPGKLSDFGLTPTEVKFVKSLNEPELRKVAYLFFWVQKEAIFKCSHFENFKPETIQACIEGESRILGQIMVQDYILEKDSMVLFKKDQTIGAISWQ